jgi:hypothetical protein
MIEEVPLRKEQHNDPFTGNAPLSALHRFVERCGYPFRPERRPENIRTEYPRRTSWLIGCRVFRSESPPLRCLVPTGDEHILRKLQRGWFSLHRLGCCRNETTQSFKNKTGSGVPVDMIVESVSAASNEMYLPCSMAAVSSLSYFGWEHYDFQRPPPELLSHRYEFRSHLPKTVHRVG